MKKNHAGKAEVWLVFWKKHTGKPSLSYNDAVEEALCFGWIDGIRRSIDAERYEQRFTTRKADSKWSESNKKRAKRMIEAGQMTPAGQKTIDIAKKSGNWANPVRPRAEYPMPPELRAHLKKNKKAADFFDSLAPSYQREFMNWIGSAKRPETRKRRLAEAIELLKQGKRLGMR